MNNLTFPEGITHKYRYVIGGDYAPTDNKFTLIGNLYKYIINTVIDVLIDTSNVTSMNNMFTGCTNLKFISQFDTSKVTDMSYMFQQCSSLTSIPQMDTSNVTNMNSMFAYCSKLTTIPLLDCSKVIDIGMCGYNGCEALVNLGGFKNLGMQKSVSNTTGNYFLGASSKLTHESIMNVINNLYDRASAGYSVLTLKLHANTLTLLSDEEKAIATNKGWTLA